VPGPATFPPVADGTSSQYWFIALPLPAEHGAPRGVAADAAAGAMTASGDATSASTNNSAYLGAANTARVRW
jgi:hypothetical protein